MANSTSCFWYNAIHRLFSAPMSHASCPLWNVKHTHYSGYKVYIRTHKHFQNLFRLSVYLYTTCKFVSSAPWAQLRIALYILILDWFPRSLWLLLCLSACHYVCLPVTMSAYLPACLSVCLSVCLSLCLPVTMSACLSITVCLSLYLPVCLSLCLSACHYICLSVYHYVCLPVTLSACLSVIMSAYHYVCPSAYLSVCLPVYHNVYLSATMSACYYVCLCLCSLQVCCLPCFWYMDLPHTALSHTRDSIHFAGRSRAMQCLHAAKLSCLVNSTPLISAFRLCSLHTIIIAFHKSLFHVIGPNTKATHVSSYAPIMFRSYIISVVCCVCNGGSLEFNL